jgi:hypothetical protein
MTFSRRGLLMARRWQSRDDGGGNDDDDDWLEAQLLG